MTTEKILKGFLDSWNAHDHNAAVSMMTEDCIFEPSVGPNPWGDHKTGLQKSQAVNQSFR